jgi:hypothetical protein
MTGPHRRLLYLSRTDSAVLRFARLCERMSLSPVRILQSIINGPEPCSYLSGQFSAMQYARIGEMNPGDYTQRLDAGWFKFGSYLQRPLCHQRAPDPL